MNENDFLKQSPTPEKPDNEKILEEVFGCSVADFIAKVKAELPASRQNRIPFLLTASMHVLSQEQLIKGGELAGDAKAFGTILREAFENYLQQ